MAPLTLFLGEHHAFHFYVFDFSSEVVHGLVGDIQEPGIHDLNIVVARLQGLIDLHPETIVHVILAHVCVHAIDQQLENPIDLRSSGFVNNLGKGSELHFEGAFVVERVAVLDHVLDILWLRRVPGLHALLLHRELGCLDASSS